MYRELAHASTSRHVVDSLMLTSVTDPPYGVTTFRAAVLQGAWRRWVRWAGARERGGGPLRATEGSGAEPRSKLERLEFHWTNAPVPAAVPAGEVPLGFEGVNAYLDQIMSLHWAKGRDVGNVTEAVASRWLLRSLDWFCDPGWTVAVPHSIQRPGESRTWHVYVGAITRPSQVARRLPDGTVHEVSATVNYQDTVMRSRDAVGREKTYTYAANGIDLLEVRNTTPGRTDLLARYANYTAGHLPQTLTDAAGQVTQMHGARRGRIGLDLGCLPHPLSRGGGDPRLLPLRGAGIGANWECPRGVTAASMGI